MSDITHWANAENDVNYNNHDDDDFFSSLLSIIVVLGR